MKAMREADIIYVSPISEWEIALKWRDGGIELPMSPREMIRQLVDAYSLTVMPLSDEVMFKSTELPDIHRDPADRFIIATAILGNLTVITTDRRFAQYGISILS